MPFTTEAAVVESAGAEFVIQSVELDNLRPHEVLIDIKAAGLCHTDLSVAGGGLPFPLPGVLGHEGAGIVAEVGSAVARVHAGDRVVLSFTSCGSCGNCRDGHPAYCDTWLPENLIGGARNDGTSPISRGGESIGGHFFGQSSFAGRAVVDERSIVKVETTRPLEHLSPLACGVQTGAGAVWNAVRPKPGSSLVVFGVGAVGLSAIMAAVLTPAVTIIAVDRVPSRLELARELGATHTIDASLIQDVPAEIRKITEGGADAAIEATGNTKVLEQAVFSTAARGQIVAVGAPAFGATAAVDVNFIMAGRRVQGITLGDSEIETLIPAIVALMEAGRFPVDKLITTYKLEDINRAAEDMRTGSAIKPVMVL
ncbi:NAD(P)-dependent alcohol dehydrogenase [Arthrobacter sp. 24S4-2]|uniref:NAD(P)-dependent alcohol dehydrogenase n=1 Tax=Arthrobacter sp. 24S4-2 TaxID=2575374 RepID=UPI0010C78BEF|nr:NAD(P)-dependent alcohol dehydrogenase [Arthrobacter sp. 24S4-2]QCO98634.1 NAD(P)-dependent alcohol dehydrogenase [Arthrobacter sp. 24S4-2]